VLNELPAVFDGQLQRTRAQHEGLGDRLTTTRNGFGYIMAPHIRMPVCWGRMAAAVSLFKLGGQSRSVPELSELRRQASITLWTSSASSLSRITAKTEGAAMFDRSRSRRLARGHAPALVEQAAQQHRRLCRKVDGILGAKPIAQGMQGSWERQVARCRSVCRWSITALSQRIES
jgi:hypothetical protein